MPILQKESLHTATVLLTSDLSQVKESGIANLLWELRAFTGDLMWLKTEEYIHNGVQFEHHKHSPDELMEVYGEDKGLENKDSHKEHKCEHGEEAEEEHAHHHQTIIKSKEDDWRGILGDLERAVNPYSDEHNLSEKPEELLPWFRLITLFNPHFIKAYQVGGFWLSRMLQRDDFAIEFLQEGLYHNPEDPEILIMLARIYLFSLKRPETSLDINYRIIKFGEQNSQSLTEDQRYAVQSAYRFALYSLKTLNKMEDFWTMASKAAILYPNDIALHDYLYKIRTGQI